MSAYSSRICGTEKQPAPLVPTNNLISPTLLLYIKFIVLSTSIVLGATGIGEFSPQDESKETTVKYFKTRLSRKDLLKEEIDVGLSERVNHFKATYNHKGKLIYVEFVPNGDKLKARMKKRDLYPRPQPPFRYFKSWNPHIRKLQGEISEIKLGEGPFYRASYLDSILVKTVEYFRRRNRRLWTYFITWDEDGKDSKLSIVFSTRQPLTTLDLHLFHPTASEMKPGWIADFKHDRLGRPLEVSVHDDIGSVYYFYRFKHRSEEVGDTLNPTINRIISSEYYRSDSTFMGRHTLVFTEANRLIKKQFFNALGDLTETIEYEYDPKLDEVAVIIRDPKGNILHREVRKR